MDNIPESAMRNYIHHMSHAWVDKEENRKRGHFPPTQQRIDRLLEVVKANDYEHGELYGKNLEPVGVQVTLVTASTTIMQSRVFKMEK